MQLQEPQPSHFPSSVARSPQLPTPILLGHSPGQGWCEGVGWGWHSAPLRQSVFARWGLLSRGPLQRRSTWKPPEAKIIEPSPSESFNWDSIETAPLGLVEARGGLWGGGKEVDRTRWGMEREACSGTEVLRAVTFWGSSFSRASFRSPRRILAIWQVQMLVHSSVVHRSSLQDFPLLSWLVDTPLNEPCWSAVQTHNSPGAQVLPQILLW